MDVTFSLLIIKVSCLMSVRVFRGYDGVIDVRFSKRAHWVRLPGAAVRSHSGELDAVRRHDRAMSSPIGARRLADDRTEGSAERAETGEADSEAHVGDAAIGLAQQEHRALHAPSLQVAVRGLAEYGAETAAEVGGRDVGDRGDGPHIERIRVVAIHRIPSPQQAPIQILGLEAHAANARAALCERESGGTSLFPRAASLSRN
jgi:hypothetical protein